MTIDEMRSEIKVDLGCDINSLGISDNTIDVKIKEAVRKVGAYAPQVCIESFPISNGKVEMPEDTVAVVQMLSNSDVSKSSMEVADDRDLFSVSRYLYNYNDMNDPHILLMQRTGIKTLQQFVSLKDTYYNKQDHCLYLSNIQESKITLKYLRKIRDFIEITDPDIIQIIKEYALSLCKIIEGEIRRKLQSAPGAIHLDGDNLVSEGMSEKSDIESRLIKDFQNIRFGIRV